MVCLKVDNLSIIEFFTGTELQELSSINLGTSLHDNKDYSKW